MPVKLRLSLQRLADELDGFLDSVTAYRLVLYFLLAIVAVAIFGSLVGEFPFHWYSIVLSAAWLAVVCKLSNWLLARALGVPTNKHSELITALILSLILTPASSVRDYLILGLAGGLAMASKYLLVFRRAYFFNPAALGAFGVGWLFNYTPSWWVGTAFLAPLVLAGSILTWRKMRRFGLAAVFLAAYIAELVWRLPGSSALWHGLWLGLAATPVLFFAGVMLIEPLTSPNRPYLPYGLVVGLLYSVPSLHLAPETALLIGNLLAAVIEPRRRWRLRFIKRQRAADGLFSYFFQPPAAFRFQPGQYLEWTLPRPASDARGNRRYFTIASSPTEPHLQLTLRQPMPASSFKQQLARLKTGDGLLASHLAGSFVLPADSGEKLVFLAGGVGITPFRSMIKYLLDERQRRDIILLYSANTASELVFTELFKRAKKVGLRPIYTLTAKDRPAGWRGQFGPIDRRLIKKMVPDYKQRRFYVSGPYGFVKAARLELIKLGLPRRQIITDYFPGYG